MISKAKACIGGSALMGYVVNEKKGYELERNNISGENPSELFSSMQIIQNQNLRCKNNTISLVLSPEKEDGHKLTNEQWKLLARSLLQSLDIKVDDAQFISFIHTEKEHKHMHIILNRVTDDGSLIKDHFIGKRVQHIAHRLAKEMDLISAMEVRETNKNSKKELLKDFRSSFRASHMEVKKQYPLNIEEYTELMKKQGFTLIPSINKQGDVQGYKVQNVKGDLLKLSEIDRTIKLDEPFFNTMIRDRQEVNQPLSLEKTAERRSSYKFKR